MPAYSRAPIPFFTSNRTYTPVNGYSDILTVDSTREVPSASSLVVTIPQPIHSLRECKNPFSCQQKYSLGVKHNIDDDEQGNEYKEMLRNSDQTRDDLERSLRFLQIVIEDAAEAEKDDELDEELLQMVEEGMEKLVEGLEYQERQISQVGTLAVEIMNVDELARRSNEQFQEINKVVRNLSQPIRGLHRADNRNNKRRSWDYHSMSRWRKGEQRIFNYKNNAFNSYPRVPMKRQRSAKYTCNQFRNPKFPNNQYPNNLPNILKPRNNYQSKCPNNRPNYNAQFQDSFSSQGTRTYIGHQNRPNSNNNVPHTRSNYHVIPKRRSFPCAPRPITSRPVGKTRA